MEIHYDMIPYYAQDFGHPGEVTGGTGMLLFLKRKKMEDLESFSDEKTYW